MNKRIFVVNRWVQYANANNLQHGIGVDRGVVKIEATKGILGGL